MVEMVTGIVTAPIMSDPLVIVGVYVRSVGMPFTIVEMCLGGRMPRVDSRRRMCGRRRTVLRYVSSADLGMARSRLRIPMLLTLIPMLRTLITMLLATTAISALLLRCGEDEQCGQQHRNSHHSFHRILHQIFPCLNSSLSLGMQFQLRPLRQTALAHDNDTPRLSPKAISSLVKFR